MREERRVEESLRGEGMKGGGRGREEHRVGGLRVGEEEGGRGGGST